MFLLRPLLRVPWKLRRKARRSRVALLLILFAIICLLVAPALLIYRPPGLVISYFQYKWPDVLWQVSTTKKIVALTIDDAPSEYTEEILKVLREHDSHATFFVIGSQVTGREQVLARIVENQHELGNHAMHDQPSRSLTDKELSVQIKAVSQAITQAYIDADLTSATAAAAISITIDGDEQRTNVTRQPTPPSTSTPRPAPPRYFRPGSGFFSARMLKVLDSLGYHLVLGGIYPHDPQISWSALNAAHILSLLRPGGIIICHDRRSWTAPMLRKILPEMRRRGYRVTTVTELLKESDSVILW